MVDARQALDRIFPRQNVKPLDKGATVHVSKFGNTEINQMTTVSEHLDFDIKRSGPGITITATCK